MLSKKGTLLIEVLLAITILGLIVTSIIGATIYGRNSTMVSGQRARAVFLAEEGIEAVRNIRDNNFSLLVDGTHGLTISGNQWVFSGSQDVNDIFTRRIIISTFGTQRKMIVSEVETDGQPGLVAITTLLTNWRAGVMAPGDCSSYCITLGYTSGTCRRSAAQCRNNGQIYESGGDPHCPTPPNNRCCCSL